MKKKVYQQPSVSVVHIGTATMIAGIIVGSISSDGTGIIYGGGSTEAARIKEQKAYNVWDDDWSE